MRKLLPSSERFEFVAHMLRERLSPEQIAGKLRCMNIPNFRDAYVWRETIYKAIYALPVGERRKAADHLSAPKQDDSQAAFCWRGSARPDPRDRQHPCASAGEDRLMPGHWEGDLIKVRPTPRPWARWWSVPEAT
ncbi:hypothetical protein D3C75_1046800 [compost metagenome]